MTITKNLIIYFVYCTCKQNNTQYQRKEKYMINITGVYPWLWKFFKF